MWPSDRAQAPPWRGLFVFANDGDLDHLATGDGLPDYADGFDWFPGDDRDDLMLRNADPTLHQFVPVKFILPGRNASTNQRIRFWFEYDSADPTYGGTDPQDLRYSYDAELNRHSYELGPAGSIRLWMLPAHEARDWRGINEGGDFIDSTEWDSASAAQKPVYYTHADFATDDRALSRLRARRPADHRVSQRRCARSGAALRQRQHQHRRRIHAPRWQARPLRLRRSFRRGPVDLLRPRRRRA